MQAEIQAEYPQSTIQILGVNEYGHESGNPTVCEGRVLPWLQDTADGSVWRTWGVTFRDVIILDRENRKAAVFNLTQHDLSSPESYNSLKTLLLQVAGVPASSAKGSR